LFATVTVMSERRDDEPTRLALAAKAGDRSAASAFIAATSADVRRFLAHLADPGDLDDLSQETYLRAMGALARFDARASARTWLLSIARRVAADHVRLAMRRPRQSPAPDWAETTHTRDVVTFFDEGVVLRRLLVDLAPPFRVAFVATQVLGLSYAEAAEICDCPVGTIRSRVARARDALIAALDEDSGGERTGRAAEF
jgi:RNA polymerase sigma-70 factor (ECF subfamily)